MVLGELCKLVAATGVELKLNQSAVATWVEVSMSATWGEIGAIDLLACLVEEGFKVGDFIREGLQRYPIEHTRLSRPLPGDTWWHHPRAPHVLEPGSPADSHPYPVELDLPSWTVAADVDLRTWLFAFGAGIRIEAPLELRQEHQGQLQAALAVYQPA